MKMRKPRHKDRLRLHEASWSDEVKDLALIYVRREEGRVARTVESNARVLFDIDESGRVLGVEVLARLPNSVARVTEED